MRVYADKALDPGMAPRNAVPKTTFITKGGILS